MDDPERQAPGGAETSDASRAAAVLARYPRREPGELVNILHDLQAELRYLPESVLQEAAAHLGLSPSQVYGVVTFYHGFHTEPRGAHTCTVCMGTACHVHGAHRLLEQVERDVGLKAGETTADLVLTVEEVGCVGACALGPLVILDGEYHGHMTGDRLSRLVKRMTAAEGEE